MPSDFGMQSAAASGDGDGDAVHPTGLLEDCWRGVTAREELVASPRVAEPSD
jgi:hypothetical protein